ncbi:MAG: hypothetical protein L0Y66_13025 [Myxococcaceae bacterium]|nr:hypothetical protein [Myxococcaceae bacterium]MCI0673516.1 hypothetical protein [Myxococcaceae bacterium]
MTAQWRVQFDAEVAFANGGGLQAQGFRLDIPGDDIGEEELAAHTALLGAGIPIVEHLCGLEALPPEGFRFHAAPPRVAGMGTFPVRAYAVVGGG